jgi:RNA 2',3'-cyclic 3'-phosphodiesterase
VRLFFAVWPPGRTAAELESWARALQGRVIPAEKVHLTLAFLGEAEPGRAAAAARRVSAAPHDLPIDAPGYWKHNRIVWAGPRETPAGLKALVEALHLELYRAEYILERRPFAAHVTLLRNAPRPAELPALPEVDWPVSDFTLVRSAGQVYEVLERFSV